MVEKLILIAVLALGSIASVRLLGEAIGARAGTSGRKLVDMQGEHAGVTAGSALAGSGPAPDEPLPELHVQTVSFSTPSQPASAVATLGDDIRDVADSGFFRFSKDPLLEINDGLAALTPQELQQLLSQLSDQELKDWLGQTDKFIGGLSGDERKALFETLAASATGEQDFRIYQAIGDDGQRRDFMTAVLDHASPTQQVAFIQAAARSGQLGKDELLAAQVGRMLEAPNYMEGLEADDRRAADKDAAFYTQAFGALSTEDLRAIMDATTRDPLNGGMKGDTFGYDIAGTGARILESANQVTDLNTRVKVFEATSAQLSEFGAETSSLAESSGELGGRGPVMEQAAQLLAVRPDQDPTEYTRELLARFHSDESFRNAYDAFAKETVRSDNQEALNPLLASVTPVALPRNGKGGDEYASKLLGELVGRQSRVTNALNGEASAGATSATVWVAAGAANGKEAIQIAFAKSAPNASKFIGATAKEFAPTAVIGVLFPPPTYDSELAPGELNPRGTTDRVEELREKFSLGYLQGKENL